MSDAGFLLLHRKIRHHPVVGVHNPLAFTVFCILVMDAAHKERRIYNGGKPTVLLRGQTMASRAYLMAETGASNQQIRTLLDRLEKEEMITRTTSKGQGAAAIITICNYSIYQVLEKPETDAGNHQGTSKQPANNQQTNQQANQQADGVSPCNHSDIAELPLLVGQQNNQQKKQGSIENQPHLIKELTNYNPPTPQGGTGQAPKAPKAPRKDRLNVAPRYTDDFNAVWQAFPKNPNSSKQDAFKAWQRIPEAERATILPAAKVYAAEIEDKRTRQRGGDAWVVHLSTFLNKGTFRDKAQEAPEAKPDPYARFRNLSNDQWRELIRRHANGTWMAKDLGPSPSSKYCLVPRDLIDELDLADKYNESGFAVNRHHPNHPANNHA